MFSLNQFSWNKVNKPVNLQAVIFLATCLGFIVFSLWAIENYFAIWFIGVLWLGAISTAFFSIRTQLIIIWVVVPFLDLFKRIIYIDQSASTIHAYLILASVDIVLITILVKEILNYLQHPKKIQLNAVDLAVLGFSFLSLISALLVSNAPIIARLATSGMWIWPMISYYFYGKFFKSKEGVGLLVKLLFVVGLVVAIYGMIQFYFGLLPFEVSWFQSAENSENVSSLQAYFVRRGVFRTFSTMDSHSSYGIFLGSALIMAWIIRPELRRNRWLMLTLIITVGLFLSFTRFTYIMPILAAFYIFTLTHYRITPLIDIHKFRRASLILIVVVCSFFVFYIVMDFLYGNSIIPAFNNPYLRRVFGTGTLEARLRLDSFVSVFSIQNPFGNGLANSSFFASKFSFDSTDINYHNIFLDMLGSMGIIGLIIFLIFMYQLFKKALMKIRIESDIEGKRILIGLFCLILAMLTVGHFNGAIFYFGRAIPIYFWAICGILSHYELGLVSQNTNTHSTTNNFQL